jgi:hypothetical protein
VLTESSAEQGVSAVDPDLAAADFRLFPELKSALKANRFSDSEDIKSSAEKERQDIPVNGFKICFEQWPKR